MRASTGVNGSGFALNEFEGRGGNDTITGNGNTRIAFYNATAGVTVDLLAGTSHGTDAGDVAGVGTDTITGDVNRVRGSEFDDTIIGNNSRNILDGRGGDDMLTGNGGPDTFVYSTGNDTITDFDQGQGDTIDLTGSGVTSLAALLALTSLAERQYGDRFQQWQFHHAELTSPPPTLTCGRTSLFDRVNVDCCDGERLRHARALRRPRQRRCRCRQRSRPRRSTSVNGGHWPYLPCGRHRASPTMAATDAITGGTVTAVDNSRHAASATLVTMSWLFHRCGATWPPPPMRFSASSGTPLNAHLQPIFIQC